MNETIETAPKATLYAKLARIMGAVSSIPKTGYNKHFDYYYVEASDVMDMIRAKLAEEKVMFFAEIVNSQQEVYDRVNNAGKVRQVRHSLVQYAFTFACGDTGATETHLWMAEAEDDSDKGVNKSATAASKYYLLKTFMLVGDEPDSDREKGFGSGDNRPDICYSAVVKLTKGGKPFLALMNGTDRLICNVFTTQAFADKGYLVNTWSIEKDAIIPIVPPVKVETKKNGEYQDFVGLGEQEPVITEGQTTP